MKKLLVLWTLIAILISGCGSKGGNGSAYDYSMTSETAPVEEVGYEEAKEGYLAGNGYDEEVITEDGGEINPAASSEKLIYKGELYIETLEYKEALKEIKALIKKYEGIVEYESEYTSGSSWYNDNAVVNLHSTMRLRIPTKHFEAFMSSMEGAGQITNKDTEVINITKQYNDNSARIEALETQQKRLLEMMDKAETIEDMIAVESRLTEVQTDLNLYKSQKSTMDTDIEYSTITVHLDEVRKYSDTTKTFGTRFVEAIEDSWINFVETLGDMLIGLVHLLPYIIVIVLLVLIIKKSKISLPKLFKKKEKNNIEKKEEL